MTPAPPNLPSEAGTPSTPDITVIVASIDSGATLEPAVQRIVRACRGMEAEIFVVDASDDGAVERIPDLDPSIRTVRRPVGAIAPELWSVGIRSSRGRCVALTTGHCLVEESWARSLVDAIGDGVVAVGAGLLPAPGVRATDLAVFFLRYQRFLPLTRGVVRDADDVPGDNAAYDGEAVRAWMTNHPGGFFEMEFHEALRREGGRIAAVPDATAGFGRSFPLDTILRHRWVHGRQFGARRAFQGGEHRWWMMAKAPFVPLVLLLRSARAVRREPRLAGAFARCVPSFLLIAMSWAMGEAAGAMFGPKRSSR